MSGHESGESVETAVSASGTPGSATAGSGASASNRRRRRLRLGWMGAGLVLMAVAAAGAWVAGTRVRSPEQAAADAAPPGRSVVTVPVELRVLESTVVTRGDVAPEVAVDVSGPSPSGASGEGQAVVTGLFVEVGEEVTAGVAVVEVSGRPVFVMEGDRPVYRELGPGATGADVGQLQAGLVALGCDAGESGLFEEATKSCVVEMYGQAGYSVVRASETEQADLAAAREAVADAGDQLDDAEAALADAEAGPTELELLDARQAVDTARNGLDTATAGAAESVRAAKATVDDALRGVNATLVSADPDADDDAGRQAGFAGGLARTAGDGDDGDNSGGDDAGGGGDGESGGGANGGGSGGAGGGSGVAARADAAEALREALDGVTMARVSGEVEVTEVQAALTRAETELAALEAPPDLRDEERAVSQATTAEERAEEDLAALEEASGPTVPMGELVFVPALPARVDSLSAVVGESAGGSSNQEMAGGPGAGGGGGSLLVLSSAGLVVNAELAAGDAGLVSVGATAELLDETSGTTLDAEVTAVGSSLVQSQTGGLVSEVTLNGVDELPTEWSGRNVRVTFSAASTQTPVLVVPEVAVSSGSDGHERVEVVAADGAIATVGVRTGLQAEGYVEVTPLTAGELEEGDEVVTER